MIGTQGFLEDSWVRIGRILSGVTLIATLSMVLLTLLINEPPGQP